MLVRDAAQIVENVKRLNGYAKSNEKRYRDFFRKRIKNGKWIVAVRQGQDYIFAPSKFSGYASNDITHEQKLSTRDGRETNTIIIEILGEAVDQGEREHAELDEAFKAFCKEHDIEPSRHHRPRRYWRIDPNSSIAARAGSSAEEEFSEGKTFIKSHVARERRPEVRKMLLDDRRQKGIRCEICGLSRPDLEPSLHESMFEAHHLLPLAQAGERKTKLSDLALLCACCHRLIHRVMFTKSAWVSIAEARSLIVPG